MSRKRRRNAHSGQAKTWPLTRTMAQEPGADLAPIARIPHDPALPELAREQWLSADWQQLLHIGGDTLAHHPERARLAAYRAAAAAQLVDPARARTMARQALEWGCDRDELARLLLAGARDTLAQASFVARRETQAIKHFEQALDQARMSSEVRRLRLQRTDRIAESLGRAIKASRQLRLGQARPAALSAPTWLTQLAARCQRAPDLHEAVDTALSEMVRRPDDRAHLLMLVADDVLAAGDRMTALHFLRTASQQAAEAAPALRVALVRRLLALDAANSAVDLLVASESGFADLGLDQASESALRAAYEKMRDTAQASNQHGHELLLAHLGRELGRLKQRAGTRRLCLIEIGTTREDVPSQGSTRKLAAFCLQHGLHFITVDMDPHNSHMARETFARLGASGFEAVTMKGEDYLRQRPAPLDFVFLDAYDFDHGQHSELRQSRYEKYLGSRIDELACHQMHLDCAQAVAEKLWAHGVVCIDDTWRDGQRWTAKGTLAVPYLLEQRFHLLDESNRAVLMARELPADA